MTTDTAIIDSGCEAVTRPVGAASTIDEIDKRQRPYRRFQAIRGAVLSDMGGAEGTTEIQRQLVGKFSTLALQLEAMEARALAGATIDVDQFGRAAGHLRRIAETLGIERRARDVTPTLAEYLATTAAGE